jgi:hypothetical protein
MIRFASFFVFASILAPAAKAGPVTILSSWSCTDWSKFDTSTDFRNRLVLESYVYGYLSARAVLLGTDYLKGIDMRAISQEVSRQCSFRPSGTLADVALSIAHELEGK